jgi:hypothetical protein
MGPATPVAPAGPMGPAVPVAPAGPTGPAAPVAPAGPTGPAAPVAPAGPMGPATPVAPAGPTGPATPVAPAGPMGPVAPVAPAGPTGPAAPVAPAGPTGPAPPVAPAGPIGPAGPTSAQVMPVSPATHREVLLTMRTTPVVELTQALTCVDRGAAKAAVPKRSEQKSAPRDLSEDIETSRNRCAVGHVGVPRNNLRYACETRRDSLALRNRPTARPSSPVPINNSDPGSGVTVSSP